jgi:hypothetical protein
MSVFSATPYSLVFDQLIVFRVRALNSYGWGAYSSDNTVGARVRTAPNQMISPSADSYSDSEIDLSWITQSSPTNGNS